jgi:hypothetical protein
MNKYFCLVKKLIDCLDKKVNHMTKTYSFYEHANNKKRSMDNLFTNDLNKDIRRVIHCKDYIYFVIKQSSLCETYTNTNIAMIKNKRTYVTDNAFRKMLDRKSYQLFEKLYSDLFDFYNEECRNDLNNIQKIYEDKINYIDGSRYSLSKKLINDEIPAYNNKNTCTLLCVSILDSDSKLPLNIMIENTNNEINGFVKKSH